MFVMEEQFGIDIDSVLWEHHQKLERKGYLVRE